MTFTSWFKAQFGELPMPKKQRDICQVKRDKAEERLRNIEYSLKHDDKLLFQWNAALYARNKYSGKSGKSGKS